MYIWLVNNKIKYLKIFKENIVLQGFVHVSTAYSHCPRNEIREQYYPIPITAKELKNIIYLNKLPPK